MKKNLKKMIVAVLATMVITSTVAGAKTIVKRSVVIDPPIMPMSSMIDRRQWVTIQKGYSKKYRTPKNLNKHKKAYK